MRYRDHEISVDDTFLARSVITAAISTTSELNTFTTLMLYSNEAENIWNPDYLWGILALDNGIEIFNALIIKN